MFEVDQTTPNPSYSGGEEVTFLQHHECGEVDAFEEVTPMQTFIPELNDEVHVDFLGIEMLHQFVSGLGCASCGKQVIMYQYDIILIDGVEVHLDGIDTILFRERFLDDC